MNPNTLGGKPKVCNGTNLGGKPRLNDAGDAKSLFNIIYELYSTGSSFSYPKGVGAETT